MESPRSTSRSASPASRLVLVAALLSAGACAPTPHPETISAPSGPKVLGGLSACQLILKNGQIWTNNDARPKASALAICDDRVVAVGDYKDVEPYVVAAKRVIDLKGRAVTPGLVDAHCHLDGLGIALEEVSLKGIASEAEAAKKIAEVAATRPKGEWITGRGWDQTLWTPAEFPKRKTLDAVVADHPVAVRRVDGHAMWVNSKALSIAGITKKTRAPAGGKILRTKTGEPTGVLIDNAMSLVSEHIPGPDIDASARHIAAAAKVAVSRGLTGVHEMGIGPTTVAAYKKMVAGGELPLRVYAFLSGSPEVVDKLVGPEEDDPEALFRLRGIKLFADGALGSRGAALAADYSDAPGERGNWVTDAAALTSTVETAVGKGWQVGIHAIGDAGNRAVLDAYEAALAKHPGKDLRLRVEHAQVLAPDDIGRFAKLGVIASMQPTHATSDMRWAEARLGPERVKGAYAWRSLLSSGAHLAAGSDFPVEEVSPLLGIYAAVTRQDAAGKPDGGWYPEQRMTLEEAIRAFTREPAYASFSDNLFGVLRPGAVADITVYDRALAGDATLLETKVDMTVVGGRVVYERQ